MFSLKFRKWEAFTAASSLVRHEQNISGYTVQEADRNVTAFDKFGSRWLIKLKTIGAKKIGDRQTS